jgi:AP endonuclease-1
LTEELTETVVTASSTPKKSRKAAKVESTEVAAKIERSTPAKGKKIRAEVDTDEEDIAAPAKSPAKAKVNKVKAKAVLEEEKASKPKKAPVKRKAKTEDDEDEEGGDDNKVKKKRKTKGEKEAEAMPLAERTAIGALKKAMHIGAHVSAAGGAYPRVMYCLTGP